MYEQLLITRESYCGRYNTGVIKPMMIIMIVVIMIIIKVGVLWSKIKSNINGRQKKIIIILYNDTEKCKPTFLR